MPDQLIVCKSCGFSVEEESRNGETGGEHLLKQLQALHEQWPRNNELIIETTGCLCICDQPCAIAFVGTHKPSYLFGDLSPVDHATDLLTAAELYLDCKDGMVPAFKLPESLQPHRIARIPPAP
ncbi:DUF1636 domain-containing protein [Leptolyngbya sp. AN02str]|uniref:DUF1636 domain-containing protein n=1 Tax=Leptolyngbya sp. AN02str TaxID=3423363 RepID=UPI003D3167B7